MILLPTRPVLVVKDLVMYQNLSLTVSQVCSLFSVFCMALCIEVGFAPLVSFDVFYLTI